MSTAAQPDVGALSGYERNGGSTINLGSERFSIRSQIVAMFLIVMLPTFAASIFLLFGMRNISKNTAIATAKSRADSYSYWVDEITQQGNKAARNIATNKTILDFITTEYEDESDYFKFYKENKIENLVSIPSQAESVLVYVRRSGFVSGTEFRRLDEEIKYAPWYEEAMKSEDPVWNVIYDEESEDHKLTCTCPINYYGENIGSVHITFSNEWVMNLGTDQQMSLLLMLNGKVYCSNTPNIKHGDDLSSNSDYDVSENESGYIEYEDQCYGIKGDAVAKPLKNESGEFRIVLFIPESASGYQLKNLYLIYGSYCGLMLVLSLLTILLFTNTFSTRIKTLSDKMHKVADGDFSVTFNDNGSDEISQLYGDLSLMISNMQKLINDNYAARLQSEAFKLNQMEAEFKALSSQINPHFLYNTLETIRMKAYVNNDRETAALVKKLGKFMRRCLEFKDAEVTLQSELEFTKSYLELQGASVDVTC